MPPLPQRVKGHYGPPITQIKNHHHKFIPLSMAASAYHDHMVRQGFSL